MNLTQLWAAIFAAAALTYVVRMLRTHELRSKYALLWAVITALLVPLGAFPSLVEPIADLFGIAYAPSALFLLAFGFVFFVLVHFSWEMSRAEMRIRDLAEEVALLRAGIDEPPPTEPDA